MKLVILMLVVLTAIALWLLIKAFVVMSSNEREYQNARRILKEEYERSDTLKKKFYQMKKDIKWVK